MVACRLPCRSQTPRLTRFPDATCQAAISPPDGAAAGQLPPGTRMRIGVPSELNSQTSVVAFGVGGPAGVAEDDGLGDDPGPGCPTGRVTRTWPVGAHAALRMLPESASRLS